MQDQKPSLKKKTEFEAVLKNYRPSNEAIAILRSIRSAFLIGPTASGRNTLIAELLKTGQYHYILSNTTRPRRMVGDRLEYDGESYWHISEDEFLDGLKNGRYLEAAIIHGQQVSGNSIDEYKKAQEQGKIAVTDMEGIYGPPVIHSYSPEAHFVFILPPQFEDWLARLKGRGAITDAELRNRLESAQQEIAAALERDYYAYIISGDLQANVTAVHSFVRDNTPMDTDQVQAKDHAEQLLIDIRIFLESLTEGA